MSEDLSGFSMMELFRMEAEIHTATLSSGLVALEGGLATPAAIEPLMRAAHSLKGAARIVGLDAAVRVAHAMEDCLVAAQKGKVVLEPLHVDILLQGVDLLVQIARLDDAAIEAWQSEQAAAIDTFVAAVATVQEEKAPSQAEDSQSSAHAVVPETRFDLPSERDTETGYLIPMPASENEEGTSKESSRTFTPPAHTVEKQNQERPTADSAGSNQGRDRVVRVAAESLTRLMGLAGETLVQTHRLPPLVDSLWRLKGRQTGLLESLQLLEDRLSTKGSMLPAAEHELLARSRAEAAQDLQRLGEMVEAIEEFARGSEDISSRLHHEVLASRMRPMADGMRGFPRLVRDLARELGQAGAFRGDR